MDLIWLKVLRNSCTDPYLLRLSVELKDKIVLFKFAPWHIEFCEVAQTSMLLIIQNLIINL